MSLHYQITHVCFFHMSFGTPIQDRIKIVSEYDQEITQSQIADKPMAPRGRVQKPSRDTRKTN